MQGVDTTSWTALTVTYARLLVSLPDEVCTECPLITLHYIHEHVCEHSTLLACATLYACRDQCGDTSMGGINSVLN